MKSVTFRYGELFCGPGGLALGALSSSISKGGTEYFIQHAWSTDYDKDSCLTYAHNICPEDPGSVLWADVKSLDLRKLKPIDGFAYGFPCNDFSLVGKQKGFHGKYGPLYSYGVNVINLFNPKFFVAENVSGLTSANEGQAFKKILEDLSQAGNGYNLTVHRYKAEDYGVPQTRHRVIIVGIDSRLKSFFHVPAPTHIERYVTSRQALEEPPIKNNAANHEPTKQASIVEERLKHIKPGENIWNADVPKHLKLNVKSAKLSQIYKRLHPDKPSYTITGSGGGGTHGYHYSEPRALTNRERARIQTFPDKFVFIGKKESVRKQIGMAVPPTLSQIIFTSILKTIAGIPYSSVEPNLIMKTKEIARV